MKRGHIATGLCTMSAKLFLLANQRGYDSREFIEKLMHSEVGMHLYHSDFTDMWIGETYIMAVLEDEVELKQGKTFNDDFMYWAGYLFKVWSLTYPEETPIDMLKQAPVDLLLTMFLGLHAVSYELAIEKLKEMK